MITFAQISEKGEREINEDSVGFVNIGPEIRLFILADGLGGHDRGEEASSLLVEEAARTFRRHYRDEHRLKLCFENCQAALMRKQEMENARGGLKSTLVLLAICGDDIQWGHVGDSRLYYFENWHIIERTMDHSVPQMLVNAGKIKETEMRCHPDRNRLLRVMGMEWESPQYQISPYMKMNVNRFDQAFLLCSDGFWEYITEEQMVVCLKKAENVHDWLRRMEKKVKICGRGKNMDNYSAIAVWILADSENEEK